MAFFVIAEAKNSQTGINYTTTATIAKELLDAGKSPTAEAMINHSSPVKKAPTEEVKPTVVAEISPRKLEPNNNNIGETKTASATSQAGGIRATDQLLYLADLLKFEVKRCHFELCAIGFDKCWFLFCFLFGLGSI